MLPVTISWLKVTENTTYNGIWWICGWICHPCKCRYVYP